MLTIRLRRMGAHSKPFYRVVVSDSRRTPSSRVLDTIGFYDPNKKPKKAELDMAKVDQWIGKGARPSDTVQDLIRKNRAAAGAGA